MSTLQRAPLHAQAIALVTRRYPFLSGCASFANSKLIKSLYIAPKHDFWVSVEGGMAKVPSEDFVGRSMLFTGDLDRKVSAVIDRCVTPGDIAFDIGANLGLVSLRLGARVGASGMVHSFEPMPRMQDYLSATLAQNPDLNVKVHTVALGTEETVMPLWVPTGNAGCATLTSAGETFAKDTINVRVTPLSSYAKAENIDRVDFVKIDVEGFEGEVLAGGQDYFTQIRPKAFILEEHNKPTPNDLPLSLSVLNEMGYDLYGITKTMLSLELVPLEHTQFADCHDYVAIDKTGTDQIRANLKV